MRFNKITFENCDDMPVSRIGTCTIQQYLAIHCCTVYPDVYTQIFTNRLIAYSWSNNFWISSYWDIYRYETSNMMYSPTIPWAASQWPLLPIDMKLDPDQPTI